MSIKYKSISRGFCEEDYLEYTNDKNQSEPKPKRVKCNPNRNKPKKWNIDRKKGINRTKPFRKGDTMGHRTFCKRNFIKNRWRKRQIEMGVV